MKEELKKMKKNSRNFVEKEQEIKKYEDYLQYIKSLTLITPNITFSNALTLHLGGQDVLISYPGNAHTRCNVVVFFKNQNTIATGDILFHKLFPYTELDAGCNIKNWESVLNQLAKGDYENIVPGHGDLTTKTGLTNLAQYFNYLQSEVLNCIAKEMSLEATQKAINLDKYNHWGFKKFSDMNIKIIYESLSNQ